MAFPVALAAMTALGLLKGMGDKKREDNQRKEAAEKTRWTPWTGMGANQIQQADVLGSTMQGAMAGSMMGGGAAGAAGGAADIAGGGAAGGGTAETMMGGMSAMGGNAPGVNPMMAQKYPWLGMSNA